MLYSFFWVILRRLNCICRRFGTLCLFHLHRRSNHPMAPLPHSDTTPFLPHITNTDLHNLFMSSAPPPPCHPPSDWLRLFSSQTFSPINTPTISFRLLFLLTRPMKMELTECSETSVHKIQTPGNHPKGRIQHSEQGAS